MNFLSRNISKILIVNIIIAVFIRLIDNSNSNLINFLILLIFILFIIMSKFILQILSRIRYFTTNSESVINLIIDEIEEIIEQ